MTQTAILDRIQERFFEFHEANPHVYRAIVAKARLLKSRGFSHYGIKAIWEALRYEMDSQGGDKFKFNNNHPARYARMIHENEPDLRGFFQMRRGA